MDIQKLQTAKVPFDTALPHHWAVDTESRTGHNPAGHIVWCYPDNGPLGGEPVAIDDRGKKILAALAALPSAA